MKKYFWIGGFVVLTLGLILAARAVNKANPDSFVDNVLEIVSENRYDFGTISMAKGDVSHSYTLKNNGDKPVKITKIWTSCMCTKAILKTASGEKKGEFGMHGGNEADFEVSPGDTVEIEAVFDPNSHGPSAVGPIVRDIYIETNSSINPRMELKFRGVVVK